MKIENIILFFSLIISELCFNQTITFDKAFEKLRIDQTLEIPGGGYIIAGYDNSDDLIVMKLDIEGYIIWQKDFPSVGYANKSIFLLQLSNFFLITTDEDYSNAEKDAKLIKMDYDGNIIFEKIYETPNNNGFTFQTVEADSDNFLMISTNQLYKINSTGEILWVKDFNPPIFIHPLSYYTKNLIAKNSNGLFVIAGDNQLLGIDHNGSELWRLNFSSDFIKNMIKSLDNNILVFYGNTLKKINPSGEIIYDQIFKNFVYTLYPYRKDNQLLVIIDSAAGVGKFSLITSESDTIIVSEKELPIEATYMIETDDDGFLFSGTKNGMTRLLKTDANLFHKSVTMKKLDSPLDWLHEFDEPPNTFFGFQKYYISWDCSEVNNINLDYSTDGGINWIKIASNLSCDSSFYPPIGWNSESYPFYEWTAPAIFSDKFYIKVSDSIDPTVYDRSDPIGSIFVYQQYDTISTNNITMWIGNSGMGSSNPETSGSGFYWPNIIYPGPTAIYYDGLVWGGKVNGEVRVNGNVYRAGLQPGKILEDGTADNPLSTASKIFKIRKDWQSLPEGILKDRLEYDYNHWPIEAGAPWDDVNEDGVYTPGFDKPKFIGDETLFYVANDLDTSASQFTYGSNPIGLEFQTTVFGFSREDLKDVVFKKYRVINKSNSDIEDMYFTYFADVDLGSAGDDYEGFDSTYNMAYCFNGDNDDEGYYGTTPPAIGHMIVQGPLIPATNLDSARYENSWKVGFKNLGLTSSGMIMKCGGIFFPSDPNLGVYEGTIQFYNMMKGLNMDGNPIINPITGEATIWPLSGDPVSGVGWFEGDGWPGGPYPQDQRYHAPTGPFNLAAGDTQKIVIAIQIARGTDNINSITKLRELAAHVQEFYNTELVEILNTKETIAPTGYTLFQNYPNPFNPKTTIEYEVPEKANVTIKIYDILGREIKTLVNNEEKVRWKYEVEFDATNIASGVYFYRIQIHPVSGAGSFTETKKMVVLK